MTVDDEEEGIKKGAFRVYFQVISQHWLERLNIAGLRPGFETGTSRM